MSLGRVLLSTRLLLMDVLLPIGGKAAATYNITSLYRDGHVLWASATLGLILTPGALEVVYWILQACQSRASWGEAAAWCLVFGPVFPLTVIAW